LKFEEGCVAAEWGLRLRTEKKADAHPCLSILVCKSGKLVFAHGGNTPSIAANYEHKKPITIFYPFSG
jgi:hypothetical protein